MSKHRREQALKNLCWIRKLPADDLYIVEEVAFLDAALEEQAAVVGEGFWKPFQAVGKNRKIQWRILMGFLLFMWQNGSGINAINYYVSISKESSLLLCCPSYLWDFSECSGGTQGRCQDARHRSLA